MTNQNNIISVSAKINFFVKKEYHATGEKIIDFFIGLLGPLFIALLLGFVANIARPDQATSLLIVVIIFFISIPAYIAALFYFFSRRRYIFWGLLAYLIYLIFIQPFFLSYLKY